MINSISCQTAQKIAVVILLTPTIVAADFWSDLRDTTVDVVDTVIVAPVEATVEIVEGAGEAVGKLVTEGPEAAGEKLKNGVEEAGEVIEEKVTKRAKETSNRIYDQTIVDSGVEHAVSSFNEQVLEPLWPEIGKAMKSLCHNYCEAVEGQRDQDGRNDTGTLKGDGINQGYEQCMNEGCSISVTTNGDGEVTGGCFSGGGNQGCYDRTKETTVKETNPQREKIVKNNLDSTLAYFHETFGISDLNPSQGFKVNLPSDIDEVFKKNADNLAAGKQLNPNVFTSEMFLDEISTHNNPLTDLNHALVRYSSVTEYVQDQEHILQTLNDSNIGWASAGLYVAGYTKFGADAVGVVLDGFSGGLGGSAIKLTVNKGLEITGDVVDTVLADDYQAERAMVITVKHFTKLDILGEAADRLIDLSDNAQMIYVKIPGEVKSAFKAKKDNITRLNRNIAKGKIEREKWRQVVKGLAKKEGLPNPVPSIWDEPDLFRTKLECVPNQNSRCVELKSKP